MQKHLVIIREDVADEGNVGLIKVVTADKLEAIWNNKVALGFGNIDGDYCCFKSVARIKEISESDFEVLSRLGLVDLEFGDCSITDEVFEEEDEDEEED